MIKSYLYDLRVTILYKHDEKSTLSVIRSKSKTSCTPTLIYQNKKPLNHYALVILDQYQNKEPHTPSIYNNKLKKQIKKVFCKLAKHDDQVYLISPTPRIWATNPTKSAYSFHVQGNGYKITKLSLWCCISLILYTSLLIWMLIKTSCWLNSY